MPNTFDDADLFDKIILGSVQSPGVVTLTGHDRDRNWDVKAAKGADGATSSLNGSPVGGFSASFYLVRDYDQGLDEFAEWDEFQKYCDALAPDTGGKAKVTPIYHPDLARQRYTEVSVKKVYGLMHDGKGGATGKIDFIEYRPAKPKKVSSAKKTAHPVPDPLAEIKAERDALLAEAQKP